MAAMVLINFLLHVSRGMHLVSALTTNTLTCTTLFVRLGLFMKMAAKILIKIHFECSILVVTIGTLIVVGTGRHSSFSFSYFVFNF